MPPSDTVENSTKSSKVQRNVSVIVTGNFVALRLGYSIIEVAFQNEVSYSNSLFILPLFKLKGKILNNQPSICFSSYGFQMLIDTQVTASESLFF